MLRTFLLSAFVITFGCGGGAGAGDDGSPSVDGGGAEPIINGKPASAFYAQFTHAVTETEVAGAAAFAAQPDGRNAFLVQFFLLPGGELALFYAEGEGEVSSTGHSLAIYDDAKKRRSGTWRIDGAQLVLDAFMRCDGLTVNGSDALRCTLTSPIITAAAEGRAGTFRNGISASSPDDSEFADYVP